MLARYQAKKQALTGLEWGELSDFFRESINHPYQSPALMELSRVDNFNLCLKRTSKIIMGWKFEMGNYCEQ